VHFIMVTDAIDYNRILIKHFQRNLDLVPQPICFGIV